MIQCNCDSEQSTSRREVLQIESTLENVKPSLRILHIMRQEHNDTNDLVEVEVLPESTTTRSLWNTLAFLNKSFEVTSTSIKRSQKLSSSTSLG